MIRTKQSVCFILAVLVLFLLLCPLGAAAAGTIDPDAMASLTVRYLYNSKPIPNAEFDLFRIADVDPDAGYTLTEHFEKYSVRVNGNTAVEWNDLAFTLTAYIQANGDIPDLTGTTDTAGILVFSGLKTGLYLVLGKKCVCGDYTYYTQPMLISLPLLNAEHTGWLYDVTEYPKVRRDPVDYPPDAPGTVDRAVLKIWDDSGEEENRPASVTVQLLADGVPYGAPAELSAENSWNYKWHSLPEYDSHGSRIVWSVIEKDYTGYIVNISRKGITFIITNTLPVPPGPDDSPDPPVPSAPPEPPVPSEPPQRPNLPHTGGTEIPVLPQTGMLWWPVPALICAGLLFIAIGISRRKRDAM